MKAYDQQRFRRITTAMIVAVQVLLAICFIFIGLTKAAAISGIVSMFVGAALLLITLWINDSPESVGTTRTSHRPAKRIGHRKLPLIPVEVRSQRVP
jgi:hypothetical protein